MTEIKITRELAVPPITPPSLDEPSFQPHEDEIAFLHKTITDNDEELRARILAVQKEAYEKHPYPCILWFHFISLMMSQNPVYEDIIHTATHGDGNVRYILDLGCCMGTDVRKLVLDGYPASQVVGCDLRPEFISSGHKLYNDEATCPIHFFSDDMFNIPAEAQPAASVPSGDFSLRSVTSLGHLVGRMAYIYTGALFHLFDEDTQFAIALRLAVLLKREPGSTIFGRHQGLETAGYINDHLGRVRYGHSPTSWQQLWEAVFRGLDGPNFELQRLRVNVAMGRDISTTFRIPGDHLVWSVALT